MTFILFSVNCVFNFLVNLGIGGPAVGDIRSRCLRLSDQSTAEALAVRRLLGHRLPLDAHQAKSEWYFFKTSCLSVIFLSLFFCSPSGMINVACFNF